MAPGAAKETGDRKPHQGSKERNVYDAWQAHKFTHEKLRIPPVLQRLAKIRGTAFCRNCDFRFATQSRDSDLSLGFMVFRLAANSKGVAVTF